MIKQLCWLIFAILIMLSACSPNAPQTGDELDRQAAGLIKVNILAARWMPLPRRLRRQPGKNRLLGRR
jgi:hypothetical protein